MSFKLEHISPKVVGELALKDFCPRCFWLKARLGFKTPWSIFPGIFMTLDGYSKKCTTIHIGEGKGIPAWLKPYGEAIAQIPEMHWSKFAAIDPSTGVLVRGVFDEMFRLKDGTIAIWDYKTSKYKGADDSLLPMYITQLSGYRFIAKALGIGETSKTGLCYYEPTAEPTLADLTDNGFRMTFTAHVHPIETSIDDFLKLVAKAKAIAELPVAPQGVAKCKNCAIVDELREVLK